jgi:osmotically-inducible protein OsmY
MSFRAVALALLLVASVLLSGCVAVVAGGATAAGAVHDRRSVGTVLDDQTLQIAAIDRIYSERDRFRGTRIKAVVHNGVVLLIGEVFSDEQQVRAAQRVLELQGVRRVVNELALGEPPGLWRRSGDSLLTSRVKAGLIGVDLPGFDPSRVNVTTVRGEVYLMGLLTRAEADAVVAKVESMRGVQRVVKVFEYLD